MKIIKYRFYHCQYEIQNPHADNVCAYEFYINWPNDIHQLHDMIFMWGDKLKLQFIVSLYFNKHGMQRIHRGKQHEHF